jgi:ATP-dependent RNA helicase SUPV3L1/SUV3
MTPSDHRSRLTAVLGPTNTGKTHLAIERMLGHGTGMIGFPLRLLARENYDRIVRLKGARSVALITGEERIVPPSPRWIVATVESMPLDRAVDFLAVDEIQLAADRERGHVFTDRLLRARGREETMFLGAETIRPLIRRLLPEAEIVTRPRFSKLAYSGPRKITRLPPRSAVVAFSAAEVYELAELMRRQRGGAAVVLGALSPRTRNAQVGMYQAGEVDYLVATDAIGMGLNMDIDHVAFARLSKFDGRGVRRLTPAELAQIAGRAGRYMRDGSFGTTDTQGPLDGEVVEAIEGHLFEPLEQLIWRATKLDFHSPAALLRSLGAPAPGPEFTRKGDAEDHQSLAALAHRADIAARATNPGAVRLLWDVAQIPDFRKILSDSHIGLLGRIYLHLMGTDGRLPEDWVATQIARIDRTEGSIEDLTARISHIRSWTYISHRAEWLADPGHWRGHARAIEDRLSDALHEVLTQRFVDKRVALLVRRMDAGEKLLGAVSRDGRVLVEGEHVGHLEGFRFVPDRGAAEMDAPALLAAARRALGGDIAMRVGMLEGAPDSAFTLGKDGRITWRKAPVARLVAGDFPLLPRVTALSSDLLEPSLRDRIARHLTAWLERHLAHAFATLLRLQQVAGTGPARGIAFQVEESLGSIPRSRIAGLVDMLPPTERKRLTAAGLRIGAHAVYLPALLKPRAIAMRRLLWAINHESGDAPQAPLGDTRSMTLAPILPAPFYEAIGYPPMGGRAVRADCLERLADEARKRARQGPFVATPALAAVIGCAVEELAPVLEAIGYRAKGTGAEATFAWRHRARRAKGVADGGQGNNPNSPFAKLGELRLGK